MRRQILGIPSGQFQTSQLVQSGTSTALATLVGVINVNTTSATTTGATKQTLATYALPANSLSSNGKAVRITAWFITASNTNSKTTTVEFGATVLLSQVTTSLGVNFGFTCTVVRTSATAQEAIGFGQVGAGANLTRSTPAETLSGAVNIIATATTPTANGDATFKGMIVEFLN